MSPLFSTLCRDQKAFCWPTVLCEARHAFTGLLVPLSCVVTAFLLSVLIPVHLFQFILWLTNLSFTLWKSFPLQHGLSAGGGKVIKHLPSHGFTCLVFYSYMPRVHTVIAIPWGGMLFVMMGFRTCYPKIWHLGILNILNWRNFRNGMYRKDFLPFPGAPHVRGALPLPRGRDSEGNVNEQALIISPSLLHLAHSLCPITSSHDFPLLIKPSIKPLKLNCFFKSSFP